jgi:hypothetical protein
MKLTPFLGTAIAAVALLSACNGTTPTGTGTNPGTPGFAVHLTKNGANLSGRTVFLKSFNGGSIGSLTGGNGVSGSGVSTDNNGNAFVPVQANAVSGLFGVGYDASNTNFGGTANKQDASNNQDEIQWFSTPAYNLSTATGNSVPVSIDVGWNTQGFRPAYNTTVQGPNVTFSVPSYTGANSYEWDIHTGNIAGNGSNASGSPLTSSSPTTTWNNANAGPYTYQVKAFTSAGVAGGGGNQTATPWVLFSVGGGQ